jgi:hypothetical protein
LETNLTKQQFRLVIRSDFDCLVGDVLFKDLGLMDDIFFVHPKDMQDGIIDDGMNDIATNLSYVAGCHLSFDHHAFEMKCLGNSDPNNHIIDTEAPSAGHRL